MDKPVFVSGISGPSVTLEYKALNIPITLGGKQFIIPKITCFPNMHGDFILGTNFLFNYMPITILPRAFRIQHPTGIVDLKLLSSHSYVCDKGFTQEPIIVSVIDQKHWIYDKLKPNFSNNPLLLWDKSPRFCSIKLDHPFKIIRVKPILYFKTDIEEFDKQIPKLLRYGLIEPSTSPHTCTAVMVRNHAEIKRGKARMVIN
ncbi:uncharacterized protein LOC122659324 [Telopea speciosissima]|uniref:uncharacterized protein LOC122659324 n=1 Tax=Telopea speciosissima TaxID=54955 RepID=UPI001CC6105E|nr:uncharacterized protein LOC122659324 [Telopea speciosissima]